MSGNRLIDVERAAFLFSAIVDSSDDAIISKDLNGIITSWNAGAAQIFGYTADEAVGTSITRLIPLDHRLEMNDILVKIKRGEKVGNYETQRQAKDGRLIDVSVAASAISTGCGSTASGAHGACPSVATRYASERPRQARKRITSASS